MRYLLPAAGLLLAACTTVGPDYVRPETPLPATFGPEVAGPGAAVTADWWRQYADPQLDAEIEAAFRLNPSVERACARMEEAEARLGEVGGHALPEVDATGSAERARHSFASGPPTANGAAGGTYNKLKFGLATDFEMDFWGKLKRSKEGARANVMAGRAAVATVRLTLAGLVADTHFALHSFDAQLAVTRDTLAVAHESLELARRKEAHGSGQALDVVQAEGVVAALEAQQLDLARLRARCAQQLALLCGTPGDPNPASGAAVDLSALPIPPLAPPGLPADLIRVRPDVAEAEAKLKAANAAIGYAQAFKYPTFNLTGALGMESRELSDLLTRGAGTWSLGAGLYLPVLDGGKIDAQVAQARARANAAAADFTASLQNAYTEVAVALVDVRSGAAIAAALERRQASADAALFTATKRYAAGYSPYGDVLDAQRQCNDARLAVVRQRAAQLSASVQLFKALGGGWRGE